MTDTGTFRRFLWYNRVIRRAHMWNRVGGVSRLGIKILLAVGFWVLATTPVVPPNFALDGDWQNGLDWALTLGKQFGRNIDFTYGPYANLDDYSVLSLTLYVPAVIATILTAVCLVTLAWLLAKRWLPPVGAAFAVTLVAVPAIFVTAGFSGRILLIAVMYAFGLATAAIPVRGYRAILCVLSAASALATLTKFSNGSLAVGTVLLVAVFCTPGSLARRALTAAASLGIVLLAVPIFWFLAHQDLSYLPSWLSSSLQLTNGYAEAMSTSDSGSLYLVGLVGVLTVVLLIQVWVQRSTPRGVLFIFAVWVVIVSVKLGFTRIDLAHSAQSFALLMVAGLALGLSRQMWLSAAAIVLSAAAVMVGVTPYLGFSPGPYFGTVNPARIVGRTEASVKALVSPAYRAEILSTAKRLGRQNYLVSQPILAALRNKTVHVDPIAANVAWVYSLRWDPVPIFQSYSAYTPALDEINASALLSPEGPQAVLRAPLAAIDGRNPMWESPRYMSALVCEFRPDVTTKNWQVLTRAPDRCGSPISEGTRTFTAGQSIKVPKAPGSGYMVIAHFTLKNDPLNAIATALYRPVAYVYVTTDNLTYRLPRQHAEAPLILTLPKAAGWTQQFGGATHTDTISVNEAGSVRFEIVKVAEKP